MGKPQYVARWRRKLEWYEAQGISLWSEANPDGRLIVTEDTLKGGIDSGAIAALAAKMFA